MGLGLAPSLPLVMILSPLLDWLPQPEVTPREASLFRAAQAPNPETLPGLSYIPYILMPSTEPDMQYPCNQCHAAGLN